MTPQYETAFIGLPVGRSHFGAAVFRIVGSGSLTASLITSANTSGTTPSGSVTALPAKTLKEPGSSAEAKNDIEIMCDETETQLAVRIEMTPTVQLSATGASFSLKSFALFTKKAPFTYLRGHN